MAVDLDVIKQSVFIAIGVGLLILLIIKTFHLLEKDPVDSIKIPDPIGKNKTQLLKEITKSWIPTFVNEPTIIDPLNPKSILCYDPATGYNLGSVESTYPETVKLLVDRARIAQLSFSKTSFCIRRAVLNSFLRCVMNHKDAICKCSARDTGKSLIDANFGEIIPTCEKLLWTIQNGEKALSTEYRSSGRISMLQSARVEYHPIGVIGAIVSEHVAWSTRYWQMIIHSVLDSHNLSRDLVILVNGFADAGEALVRTADKITFIGSPHVGQIVMKTASESLTPVVLELGGKDAAIIFNDCDYKNVMDFCSRGSIQNAGQNCAGLERMIVDEKIYQVVCRDMFNLYKSIRVGPPLEGSYDMGAITMKAQLSKIQDLVDDAVEKGKPIECKSHPLGQFYPPTILTEITPLMKISKDEVFGPVLLIYCFKTEQDAIKIANSTPFGLSSSVFSLDYIKAERVCKQLRVGMCNINGWGLSYLCQSLPFGGVGRSGFDRFAGIEGLRGNCNIKSVTTDLLARFKLTTKVPSILKYPISKESNLFQHALLDLFYGSVSSKFDSIYQMVKILFSDQKKSN